jgi:hypothetical protein
MEVCDVIRRTDRQFSLPSKTTVALVFLFAVSAGFSCNGPSGPSEPVHVVSHDNVLMVTDPSTGTNSESRWATFPAESTEYREVTLWITYACPDSLHCGEWDYIDRVKLRRIGGEDSEDHDLELARMISPYGWRFGDDWHFSWHVDVSDFGFLLHDSVEVEFVHTGYESNEDRGWLVTLDFAINEGPSPRRCVGMDTLWCGSFPYGDTAAPIEELLHPIAFTMPENASLARLRIHQTGHGMDDSANCAEFCRKYRQVWLDDSLVAERFVWRECGDNPLYPQAGTWLFNRANWCPGSVVAPEWFDFALTGGTEHTIDIAMEPYVNPNKPSANWHIYSYLFYYDQPWATNDVSVAEIIAPSGLDEYSRANPVCNGPRFVMTNYGSEVLRAVGVRYSLVGLPEQTYEWTGELASMASEEVSLPGSIVGDSVHREFHIALEAPNGQDDEYPADNVAISEVAIVPVYPTQMVLAVRTNRDSAETSYQVTDGDGDVVAELEAGSLAAYTTWYDTLTLEAGCYRLQLVDSAGDGLDFWFNAEAGRGYVRLLDMEGRLVRAFNSDFGSSIDHWFTTSPDAEAAPPDGEVPIVVPFPPRNQGKLEVDVFFDQPTAAKLSVRTEDSSQVVFSEDLRDFKEGFVPVDISAEPDGIYWLSVAYDGGTIDRRFRVRRQ